MTAGSGKSSLMLSLFRLIDINAGSILLDGVDTASIALDSLRKQLAIIPQVRMQAWAYKLWFAVLKAPSVDRNQSRPSDVSMLVQEWCRHAQLKHTHIISRQSWPCFWCRIPLLCSCPLTSM